MLDQNSIPFRTLLIATAAIVGALLATAFVVYQARYLILGPQISLTAEPIGPQNERRVAIAGVARNISHLWLNDRRIYTNPEGAFEEALVLENGYTIITIRAEDRYGRSATIEKPLVYSPATFNQ